VFHVCAGVQLEIIVANRRHSSTFLRERSFAAIGGDAVRSERTRVVSLVDAIPGVSAVRKKRVFPSVSRLSANIHPIIPRAVATFVNLPRGAKAEDECALRNGTERKFSRINERINVVQGGFVFTRFALSLSALSACTRVVGVNRPTTSRCSDRRRPTTLKHEKEARQGKRCIMQVGEEVYTPPASLPVPRSARRADSYLSVPRPRGSIFLPPHLRPSSLITTFG